MWSVYPDVWKETAAAICTYLMLLRALNVNISGSGLDCGRNREWMRLVAGWLRKVHGRLEENITGRLEEEAAGMVNEVAGSMNEVAAGGTEKQLSFNLQRR